MLRDNRFRLITLGRLTLVGAGGEEDASLARRRLKLAVLAVLALTRRPLPRDTLLGLFWAEHDEGRARHSLSNALSSLRGALGERSITTRDADVAIDSSAPLDVDAIEFAEAVEQRDFARAVQLYEGPFLEGFHVGDSPTFDQWATRERRRLEAMFLKAAAEQCGSLARSRRWTECESVAARWLDAEPLSADAAIYLLNAIKAPGTRSALARALEEFEALRTRLSHEFELAPHQSITDLAVRIREQLAVAPPEPVVDVRVTAETKIELPPIAPTPVPSEAPPVVPPPSARITSRRHHVMARVAIAAAVVGVVAFGLTTLAGDRTAPESTPVIAVLSFPVRSADSSTAWLSDGLPQMIDTKLANVSAIAVVPAARVRALIQRSGRAADASLPDEAARDLARRVGATLVAHGSLARDAQNFVLDLSVHDVRQGSLVRNVVLTDTDPLTLADQAAARILAAVNVSSGGPRLMDIETASLEAYQYYMRHLEHAQAGRPSAAVRDLDASIALDSGFIPALRSRLGGVLTTDTALALRLRQQIQRNAHRMTEFDRLEQELWDVYNSGERERSVALARGLLRRYPRDPRPYSFLESILLSAGDFDGAEQVAIAGLSLDSLAMRAGSGPCSQCKGFAGVIIIRWLRSDFEGAEAWSRRWIAEQPDAASAWFHLAWTLAYAQKTDSALSVARRMVTLSGNELPMLDQYARMLIVSRRYAEADSVIRRIEAQYPTNSKGEVADLRSLLAREHGRPRDALVTMEELVARWPQAAWGTEVIRADNRRLMGDYEGAARHLELITHTGPVERVLLPQNLGGARAFCWHHALLADALGATGDTIRLRGIADTLQMACQRSYYGRDWRLYHHVRGLLAMRAGKYTEAELEFVQAVWTKVEGWARTTVELARARMALGRPNDAIATLRTAYATRLDAMGRYVPISELDYWMAKAFAQAGQVDSARVYSGYVEKAWANAEPGLRARLDVQVIGIQR
jgi:DNA-binding SARP family transcriptional activator/tetratricopeptide (TPR) repeat protein